MQEEFQNFNVFLEQNDYDAVCLPWIEPRESTDYTKFLNSVSDIKVLQPEEIDSYKSFFPELQEI